LYIEDLISRLACEGHYIFAHPLNIWKLDLSPINSLGQNPGIGKGYTEKQRKLVLHLCKKYQNQLETVFGDNATIALDNPEFRLPVCISVPQEKSISIVDKEVLVKFPYSEEIVASIRKFRDSCIVKLVEWDADHKAWKFKLEENNVVWIMNNLMNSGFVIDPEFSRWADEIAELLEKIEDFAPMVVEDNNTFSFKNVSPTIPQPGSANVVESLLLAKHYGISTWDENIEKRLENDPIPPILTKFLNETEPNSLEFDVSNTSIDQFTDLFKYNLPALIIIPGFNEFFTLKFWVSWLKAQNIKEEDMSVMFRLSNDSGSMFNDLVKQNNLNSPVGENTKVIFISQKMPKPLIKEKINFKLILNLGSLSGVHYSISTFLDNRLDVIRYTDKNKLGYQLGLL
jgi:hypothetical protein